MQSFKNLALMTILTLTLVVSSCSKKQSDKSEGTDPNASIVTENNNTDSLPDVGGVFELNGDSDSKKAGTLQTINFPLDSSELTSDSKATLEANALFLKGATTVKVQIEGHCDERGGVQYNIALGERRAKSVKDFLTAMGIAAKRISTISFGKEKPIALGHDEESWAKNRRANFVIVAK